MASVGLLGLVGWVCPLTIPLSTALVAVTMLTVGGTLIVALWAPWHLPGYLDVLAELLHRLGPGWTGRPRRGWRTA